MEIQSVNVKILEATPDLVKVKLPFMDIPVQMSYNFFQKRLEKGYFKIQENSLE